MRYRIDRTGNGNAVVVAFEGALDLSCGRGLRTLLIDLVGRTREVILDLSGVESADTLLAANLAEAALLARTRRTVLTVRSATPPVARVLDLARLSPVLGLSAGAHGVA